MVAGGAASVVAVVVLVGVMPLGTRLWDRQVSAPTAVTLPSAVEPLPITRASEAVLSHARALRAGGYLRDALRTLDSIDFADPFRAEADRLRADIQRDLLVAAGLEAPSPEAVRP